jgi:hypothetical protein
MYGILFPPEDVAAATIVVGTVIIATIAINNRMMQLYLIAQNKKS